MTEQLCIHGYRYADLKDGTSVCEKCDERPRGPCAKRQVECEISRGGISYVGRNDCANPQLVCPRLPGEGYEKCKSICDQAGHAEIEALKMAGSHACGATATLTGHYWICEPCGAAMRDAGVRLIRIVNEKVID